MATTQGAERLRALVLPRISQVQLARKLGVTQQAVSQWIRGNAKPRHEHAVTLERDFGIPADTWDSQSDSGR